jgi:hypothetical protein
MLLEDMCGILNFAAAGAGKIAPEKRLQHQHQRITLAPGKPLLQHITGNSQYLGYWDRQSFSPPKLSRCGGDF